MKNREIIEHINALGAFTKDKIPVKLSFAIVKNFNKLKSASDDYEQARMKLLEENSEKKENGDIESGEDGNAKIIDIDKWNKEINELMNIEVDIDMHKVDFSILDGLQLSVSDMAAIEFMIKEE